MFVEKKSDTPGLQDLLKDDEEKPKWLKSRGYLHITPKINVNKRKTEILSKVTSKKFVQHHAFFPLIHTVIKERKYKKHPEDFNKRGHSYYYKEEYKKSVKNRPLHYSTHIDSLIFGYYAYQILELYEQELKQHSGLQECITAYRKIAIEDGEDLGKSTINFASEAFNEINKRAKDDCIVLMFDIESFFSSLNHEKLKRCWVKILGDENRLPDDHFSVFNATANFKYILRDELRVKKVIGGRRLGFDERKLAAIRKQHGIEAFYKDLQEFRTAIKSKEIKVYKRQFVKNGLPVGIPQGLPISAVLANLYLLDFDLQVLDKVVNHYGAFYRRYSDDIMIICRPEQEFAIKEFIQEEIKKSFVIVNPSKTETFLFKKIPISEKKTKITSIQIIENDRCRIGKPLTYLGFEFYGEKILVKSANLAKFYRRIIYTVKRRVQRAITIAQKSD
jgi:hypothetical protein